MDKNKLKKDWYFNLDTRVPDDSIILSKLVYQLIANTSTYDDFVEQFVDHIRLTPNFAYFMLFTITNKFIKSYTEEDIKRSENNRAYYAQLIDSRSLVELLGRISLLYNEIYKFYYDILSKKSSDKFGVYCYQSKEIEKILNDFVSEDKNKAVRNLFLLYGSDAFYKHIELPIPLKNVKVDNNFRIEPTDQLYLLFNIIKPFTNLYKLIPTEEEIKNNDQYCYNNATSENGKKYLKNSLEIIKIYVSELYLSSFIHTYFATFGESMIVMFGEPDSSSQYDSEGLMSEYIAKRLPANKYNKAVNNNIYKNPDLASSIVCYNYI